MPKTYEVEGKIEADNYQEVDGELKFYRDGREIASFKEWFSVCEA